MQSLQMRWPVPGHIGLSIMTSASAPTASPALRSACISEIFSSSGQPSSAMPSGLTTTLPSLGREGPSSTNPCRARGTARSNGSRSALRARSSARRSDLKPSRRRRRQSGPTHRFGQLSARAAAPRRGASSRGFPESGRSPSCDRRGRAVARRTSASGLRCRDWGTGRRVQGLGAGGWG